MSVALVGASVGFVLGSLLMWRRMPSARDLVSEASVIQAEAVSGRRERDAKRDLDALRALRDGNAQELEANLEQQVSDHYEILSSHTAALGVSPDVLREIAEYRESHPVKKVPASDPNGASLFASAKILLVYEDASIVGIQVSRIQPGSIWAEMGLRDRDVLVEIDGVPISSPQAAAHALEQVTGPKRFEVARIDETRVRLVPADE